MKVVLVPVKPLPTFVADVAIWQREGACRGVDPDLFFVEAVRGLMRDHLEAKAKAICATCPVLVTCREYGIQTQEPYGIWGGLTRQQRRAALRSYRWNTSRPHALTVGEDPRSTKKVC